AEPFDGLVGQAVVVERPAQRLGEVALELLQLLIARLVRGGDRFVLIDAEPAFQRLEVAALAATGAVAEIDRRLGVDVEVGALPALDLARPLMEWAAALKLAVGDTLDRVALLLQK